jgi:hypothetical protein
MGPKYVRICHNGNTRIGEDMLTLLVGMAGIEEIAEAFVEVMRQLGRAHASISSAGHR